MPALIVTITGDANKLKAEMDKIDAMAKRTGQNIKTALRGDGVGGPGGVNSGAMHEALVLVREISRGNWTRVPGSLSILISRLNAFKILLNPVVIGLTALGAALFFVGKHFSKLSEEARNFRDVMDLTRIKFTEQARAMKEAAEQAQGFRDWLRLLGKEETTLGQKMEDTLRAMREKAKLEREAAKKGGASSEELARMDVDEAKAELKAVNEAIESASKKLTKDKQLAQTASKMSANSGRAALLNTVAGKTQTMAQVVEAIEQKMRNTRFDAGIDEAASRAAAVAGGMAVVRKSRRATGDDVFSVKVGDKDFRLSLNQAKAAFGQLTTRETQLAKAQKEYADLLQRIKSTSEKDATGIKELQRKKAELEEHIKNLQKQPEQAVSKMMHGSVNALQAIGAYASPAASALVDINKKMHHELKGIHSTLKGKAFTGQGMMGGKF